MSAIAEDVSTLTIDIIRDMKLQLQTIPRAPEIIVSAHALETTDERLFPASKNRSRRIHKKLVKRFGGEFVKRPAIFHVGDKVIMHPVRWHEMKAHMAAKLERSVEQHFYNGLYSVPVRGDF